ncbi:VOC family protein [Paenalcaligenes niemegkensis]|uniref:VOC family protein n=1 Tax=Paenalcaligenes niemegkensis TaxID=2895469 RepID=UPI001EE7D644|nr:VOC family protein [Paenalcaligenes niemegkensis]MCQ9617069.1 VOC family protein [Paenalcaligenes niemegkensis]
MAKLIHTMIRISNLDISIKFYRDALGLHEKHRLDFPTFTLVYLGNEESPAEIELTYNKNQSEPYEHGTAYGHVAFSVENLEASHSALESMGLSPTPIKQLEQNGHAARFFFLTDPDGYKIEVLQSGGHY